MSRRAGLTRVMVATPLAAFALICAPSGAQAATTTLGEIAPLGSSGAISQTTFFQGLTDPGSPSYVVPGGGPWTITAWSARGGPTTAGQIKLRVFRPLMNPGDYQLVAESAEETLGANAAPSFTTSIPVQAGDLLGIRIGLVGGDMAGNYATAFPNDIVGTVIGDPMVGGTIGSMGNSYTTNGSLRINVSATLFTPDPPVATPSPLPTAPTKRCKKGRKLKKGKCVKKKRKKKRGK